MKNDIYDYLIFKLDDQYEKYEFVLIPIPPYEFIENGISLEPYEYFGDSTTILGLRTKQIILYFNCDILMRVKLFYNGNLLESVKDFLNSIAVNLPAYMTLRLYYDNGEQQTIIEYQKKILGQNNLK